MPAAAAAASHNMRWCSVCGGGEVVFDSCVTAGCAASIICRDLCTSAQCDERLLWTGSMHARCSDVDDAAPMREAVQPASVLLLTWASHEPAPCL